MQTRNNQDADAADLPPSSAQWTLLDTFRPVFRSTLATPASDAQALQSSILATTGPGPGAGIDLEEVTPIASDWLEEPSASWSVTTVAAPPPPRVLPARPWPAPPAPGGHAPVVPPVSPPPPVAEPAAPVVPAAPVSAGPEPVAQATAVPASVAPAPAVPMSAADAPESPGGPARPRGARRPRRVRLVVLAGKARGRLIEVSGPSFVIGRGDDCQMQAWSLAISRRHLAIERDGDRVLLRDLGSTNGTAVNDRLLFDEAIEAADGDLIQLGPLQFTLTVEPVRSAEAARPAAAVPAPAPPPPPAITAAEPPRAPAVAQAARPAVPAGHDHSAVLCPQCGAQGWVPFEVLVQKLLHVLRREFTAAPAMSPAHKEAPHRPQPQPRPSAAAPASAARWEAAPAAPQRAAKASAATASVPIPTFPTDPFGEGSTVAVPFLAAGADDVPPAATAAEPFLDVMSAPVVRFPAAPSGTPVPPASSDDLGLFVLPEELDLPPDAAVEGLGTTECALTPATPEGFLAGDALGASSLGITDASAGSFVPEPAPATRGPDADPIAEGLASAPDDLTAEVGTPSAGGPSGRKPAPPPIEINCPNPACQAPWVVPHEHLDRQMACRACGTAFYMDPGLGRLVIGLSAAARRPGPASGPPLPRAEVAPRPYRTPRLRRYGTLLKGMAAALVLVLAGWYAAPSFFPPPKVPNQVIDRSHFLARAVARDDLWSVKALSEPSTQGDARRWYRRARPAGWPSTDEGVAVAYNELYTRQKKREACVEVGIAWPKGVDPSKGATRRPAPKTLKLFWTLSHDNQWRFDGTRTLKDLK